MRIAMKYRFLLFAALLSVACSEEPQPEPNNKNNGTGPVTPGQTWSVNGSVQKGPFTQGTSITIQALDESLNPTGKNYSTKTTDDAGSFAIGSQIESRYVEIIASGYYFNEIEGKVSSSTLTLRSLSDLSEEGKTNVNLLTTLESDRMMALVKGGKTVADARKQAEQEIFGVFNIPNTVGDTGFDKMDITKGTDADAILLAISASLQAGQTVGELSELISKIAGELASAGKVESQLIMNKIVECSMKVDADKVRDNLTKRYTDLGKTDFVIPPFEDYLDVNGNGVIDKKDSWIILGQDDFVVSDKGGSFELTLQHNVEYEVSVEGGNWLSWQDASTKAYLQDAKIIFTAEANNETDARYAVIKIKDRATAHVERATVTQKQKDALTVSASTFELEKEGGSFELVIGHNMAYQLDYADAPWLTLVQTKAMESNTATFSAAANPEVETRVGHIIVSGEGLSETVTVYQKGGRTLVLSQKNFTVGPSGGEVSVQATANVDYEVIGPGVAWLTLKEGTSTKGVVTNNHTWTVSQNDMGEERQATILFKDKESDLSETVTVTQQQNDIIDGQAAYTIPWEGGTLDVPVQTNAEFAASIEQEGEWLSVIETKALHASTVTLSAQANPDLSPRTANLVLTTAQGSWRIAITQKANAQQVTVHVATPGTLSDVISTEDLHKIVNLKITGQLNASDLALLKGGVYHPYDPGTFVGTGHDAYFECDWCVEELDLSEMTTTTDATGEIFQAIPSLTKVIMPLHVETVSNHAFSWCINLETIDFGVNSDIITICGGGDGSGWTTVYWNYYGAFENCQSLKTVTLPDNLEEFQAGAFLNCTSLEEVVFPESCNVRTLSPTVMSANSNYGADLPGMSAATASFGILPGCSSIETLVLPKSLRKIQLGALAGVQARHIIFPDGLTSVDSRSLFYGCSRLEEVTLPSLITEFGSFMFYGCKSLTKIETQANITRYGDYCFAYANPAFLVLDPNAVYGDYVFKGMDAESLTIPDNFTEIPCGMFANWTNLKSINFGGVEKIGKKAFLGCTSLSELNTLPLSLKYIDDYAFYECNGLKDVVLPESVTYVGEGAFYLCDWLETVEVRCNYVTFGERVFGEFYSPGYSSAIRVTIANTVVSATGKLGYYYDYEKKLGRVSEIVFEEGSRCEEFGLAGETNIKSISLPSSIKRLTNDAFTRTQLKSIDLPSSLEYIGEGAFRYCAELRKITIPAKVETLASGAFSGCEKLYEFSLSENSSLRYIGSGAFSDCRNLEIDGKIFSTVTSIGGNAFSSVSLAAGEVIAFPCLTSLEPGAFSGIQGTIKGSFPVLETIGDAAFEGVTLDIEGGFPKVSSVWPYAFNGATIVSEVEFSSLTSLGSHAFNGVHGTLKASFPVLESIPGYDYVFQNTTLDIKGGFPKVTSIGSYAFSGATIVSEVAFPSLTSLEEWAFRDLQGTLKATFPVLETIPMNAFWGCTALETLAFPAVKTIGAGAFYNSSLRKVTFGPELTSMGYDVFYNADKVLEEMHFQGRAAPTASGTWLVPNGYSPSLRIYVPASSYDSYKASDSFKEYVDMLVVE